MKNQNNINRPNSVFKKGIFIFYTLFILALAIPANAQTPQNFSELINNTIIRDILRPLVPFLISLAVIIFIYGVLLLVLSQGGEKKEDGKKFMFWGIIGIFVMVSIWGLVAIMSSTFRLDNTTQTIQMTVPTVQVGQ